MLEVTAIKPRGGIQAWGNECFMDAFGLPSAGRSQETVSPSFDHDLESLRSSPNKDLFIQG